MQPLDTRTAGTDAAGLLGLDETAALEHPQMLQEGWEPHVEGLRQLCDRRRAPHQACDDGPPGRIRQGVERTTERIAFHVVNYIGWFTEWQGVWLRGCCDLVYVERNNGVYGGCWCIGWHLGTFLPGTDYRSAKEELVRHDRAHAALVFDEHGLAQGWCQYGSAAELPIIKHSHRYKEDPPETPSWRIACCFVDKGHRGQGIVRLALGGALAQIAERGGGLVEAISEVTDGREAQGRFLFSATAELFEDHGFERVSQVGKHAWIVTRTV